MCVSQRRWMGYRGLWCSALPLILLLPLFAQGAIHIPKTYKMHDHDMPQPPLLTETPKSFTAFSREDINLPCEASGNPTPTFRWVKDGTPVLERKGFGTLQDQDLNKSLDWYEGYYKCYASNTLGTAMTQTVKIIIESQPVLQKQQKVFKTAHEGDSIILPCHPPKSKSPPALHWMDVGMVHFAQNDRVTIGLDGNLYFANVLKNDSRDDYICHAQYKAAMTILPATSVTLTVTPSNDVSHGRKPHLLRPTNPSHSSVFALRGLSVNLECIPKGLPTPKVEWRKKDGSLEETTGKTINYNHRLHFASITQDDDGEYACEATNVYGVATHTFTITVEAAPYWVKEPQNLQYALGETVRLDCQAEGIPTPTITWRINGELLSDVDDEPRRSISGGVLILRDVELADNAVYQCEASNVHGSILLNTFLHVVKLPPQILSSDGVVYKVIEGGHIQLHCESFGSPRPHITWENEDMVPLLSDPRVSLLTNGTVELSNVSYADSGEYNCYIKNSNISITANLEVFNRTVILTGPQDIRVLRGASAQLDCHFYRDPRLHDYQVVWKKDGHKLLESSLDDKYTMLENNALKVTNIQSDDTAQYSCEVITGLDHVNAVGSITVEAPPDPPSHLSLSNIEDHSLTLSWTPGSPHNSPITEFIVEAREEQQHTETGKSRWEELKRVTGDFDHVELTLRPFSIYHFRVVAVNKHGRSNPSNHSERHKTPQAAPDNSPTGVRSAPSEPGTLIITWDEMDKHFHNGEGFYYKVFYREADVTNLQWSTGNAQSPPFIVNNTGTYKPFEIRVQAANVMGAGPEPEVATGHSGEDMPEEAPTGVSTTVMNSTVIVRWNEAQKVRGLLLGYKIYIRWLGLQKGRSRRSLRPQHHEDERDSRGTKEYKDNWMVVVDGAKTSEELTGLRLFSKYDVVITAFNSKGESPPSVSHSFNTPEGAPGPPASLRFESPSEKSLILHWTPPRETNGILLGYLVQYQKEDEKKDVKMEFFPDPTKTQTAYESLDPNSHYNFSVIARTASGDGPPITVRAATLLDGVPPTNVSVAIGMTSLNLSWVPGERGRDHSFYIRCLRKSAGGPWEKSEQVSSHQGFYSLTGLEQLTEYHLMIMYQNVTQWEDVASTGGPGPSEMPGGFATQGWLIGLISAIVLLVLILLILCLIKRRKGGKYAVKGQEEKVDSEARPMKDEAYGDYSDRDEKRSDSQPSLSGDSKLGSDDSLAEYGDSVDIQFNEDGSFIGQYSGRGPVPHGNESSSPNSPVSAVPPPPIAPSMSSILNRPS
ncbi:neural cell adhesion molecule L1-like isoform X2 [Mugil cephalus]|uniref:neural cell adhesion molecule L1-like isoform X2 n=1 Tax=Mugil cephalus TaxID=48193 RepID=UPI001FB753E5|nr:neural cell adhesion molecule L1-like isoform X2 [Mugil cephalus]